MNRIPLVPSRIVPQCSVPYQIFLDDSISRDLIVPEQGLRPNVKNLEVLRRYKRFVRVTGSYSLGLNVYISTMFKIGQVNVGRCIIGIMSRILRGAAKNNVPEEYLDDWIRKKLKMVSNWAYVNTFERGLGYSLLVHLHTLGGKSPFTSEQILEDINLWTDTKINGREKDFDRDSVMKTLDKVFTRWLPSEPSGHLSFDEFCNDVLRWGTNGGGPRTDWIGGKYRTKWAWGLSKVLDNDGKYKNSAKIYQDSKKYGNIYNVALKEEPAKTREVITAPISCYLRQSYLMYRWGKPKLNSPISNDAWLKDFQNNVYSWYGAIDGERFDHCVPKWFVEEIITRLGNLDEECRAVADEEIRLLQNLKIVWKSKHRWGWSGGLLSGWRLTSVIGSIASECASDYILSKLGKFGAINNGVMGDDLIMYSHSDAIDKSDLVDAYNSFGLVSNMSKTVCGSSGEFLRKICCERGILGYAALGLKSILYASPWVTKYTYDNEIEISNSWLTYYSRLLPHTITTGCLTKYIQQELVNELNRLQKDEGWIDWLRTPISAGGGGPSEWSDPSVWTTVDHTRDGVDQHNLINLLGVLKPKYVFVRQAKLRPVDILRSSRLSEKMSTFINTIYSPVPKKNINFTSLLSNFLDGSISVSELNKCLTSDIPRGLRCLDRPSIVRYLLGVISEESGITTVQHTKEQLASTSRLQNFVSRAAAISKGFSNRLIKPAITLYSSMLMHDEKRLYGTW